MDHQPTNQQNSYSSFSKTRQDDRISKRNNYGPMFPYGMKQCMASKCKTGGILCQNQNNQVTKQSGRDKPETVNIYGNQQGQKNASFKRYTEGNLFFNKGKQKYFSLRSNRSNHDSKFLAYSPPGSYFKREHNSQSVNHRKDREKQSSVNVPMLDDHRGNKFGYDLRQIIPLPPAIQSTIEVSQHPSTSPLSNKRVNPGLRSSVHVPMLDDHRGDNLDFHLRQITSLPPAIQSTIEISQHPSTNPLSNKRVSLLNLGPRSSHHVPMLDDHRGDNFDLRQNTPLPPAVQSTTEISQHPSTNPLSNNRVSLLNPGPRSSVHVPMLDDHRGDNFDLRQNTPLPPAIQSTIEISQQPTTSPLSNNRVSLLNPGPRLAVNTHNTIEKCVQHAFNSKRNVFEKFQHLTEMKDFSKPLEEGDISRRPLLVVKNLNSIMAGSNPDFHQLEHVKHGHNSSKEKYPENHGMTMTITGPGPKPNFCQLEHFKQVNNFVKDKNPEIHENLISFVPGPKPDFSHIEHVKQGHNLSKDKISQNHENQNRFVPGQKLNFSKPEPVKDKNTQNHENLNSIMAGSNPDFGQLEHVQHGPNFSKDKNPQNHESLNSFVPGLKPVFCQLQHVKKGINFSEEANSENHKTLNKYVLGPKPDFSQFEHVKHGHDSVEVKNPQKHEKQATSSNMKSCFKDNSCKSGKSYKVNFHEEVKVVQADGSKTDVQLVDNKVYKRYKRMIFKEKTRKLKKGVTLDKSEESKVQTKHPMTDSGCNKSLQNQELQKVGPNYRLVSSSFKGLSSNNSNDAKCKEVTEKKSETGGQAEIKYDVVTKTISEMTASKKQDNLCDLAHVKSKKSQTGSEHSINLSESKQLQTNGKVNQLIPKANLMSKNSLGYSSIKDKSSTRCGEKIDEMIPNKVHGENFSKGNNEIKGSVKTASTFHSQNKFTSDDIHLSCAKVSKNDTDFFTSNVNLEHKNIEEGNEKVTKNTERQEIAATTMNLEENSSKIYVKQNSQKVGQSSEPYLEIYQNTCKKYQNRKNYFDNSKMKNKNGTQMGLTESHRKVVNNSADENAEQSNKEHISELVTSNEFSGNKKQCSKCQRSINHSVLIYVATDDSFTGNNDKCSVDKGVLNEPSRSLHRPQTISNKNFKKDVGIAVKQTEDLHATPKLAPKIAMQNTFESSGSLLKEYYKPAEGQLQKKDRSSHSSMIGKALRNKMENKSYEKCPKHVEATSGKKMYDSTKKCSMKKLVSSETKSGLQNESNCNEAIENVSNKQGEANLNKAEKTNMTKLPKASHMCKETIEIETKKKDKTRSYTDDKTGCYKANETNSKKSDIKYNTEEQQSSSIGKYNNDESRSDVADKITRSNSHRNKYSYEGTAICNEDQTKCNTACKDKFSKADKTNIVKKHNEKVQSKFCKLPVNKTNNTNAVLKTTDRDSVDKTTHTVKDKTLYESDTSKLYKPNTKKYTKADLAENDKHSTNYLKEDSTMEQGICHKDGKSLCSSTDKTKSMTDLIRPEKDETSSCKLDKSNADKTMSNKKITDHTSEKNNSCKEDNTNFGFGGESRNSTHASIYDKTSHKIDDRNSFGTNQHCCTKPDGTDEVNTYFEKDIELPATNDKLADKGKGVCSMVNGKRKANESKLDSFLGVHPGLSSSRGKTTSESSSVDIEEYNAKHNQSSLGNVVKTSFLEPGEQQASNPKACLKRFQESGDSRLIHAICGEKRLVIKLTDILSHGHKLESETKSTDMSKPKGATACKFHDWQFKQDEDFVKTSKRALRMGGTDGKLSVETSCVKVLDEEKKEARRNKRTTTTNKENPVKKAKKDSDAKGQKSINMENKSDGSECRSILRQYVSKMSANIHDQHPLVLKIKCIGDQNETDRTVFRKRAISVKNNKPSSNAQKIVPYINQTKDCPKDEYKRKCVKQDESKEIIQSRSQAGKMRKKNENKRKISPKKCTITLDEQSKITNMSKKLKVEQMKAGTGKFFYGRDSVNKEDSSNNQSPDDSKLRTSDKEDESKIINKRVLPTTANTDMDKANKDIKLKVNAKVKEMVKTTGKKNQSKAFKYICPACQKKFQTIADFRLHKKGSHPFLCHKCGLDFPDKASKTKHRWTHADVAFTCEQCKMRFGGEKTYKLHLGSMKHAAVVARLSGEDGRKNQVWQDSELSQAVASIQEPPVLDNSGFGRSWLCERGESSMMYSSPSDCRSETVQKSMTLTEPRFLYADSNASDGDHNTQTSWTVFLTEPDVSVSFDDGLTNNCGNDYLMAEFGSSNSGLYSYAPATNCMINQSQSQVAPVTNCMINQSQIQVAPVTSCMINQSQSQVEAQSSKLHSQIPTFSTIDIADIQCEMESSSDSNLHQVDERYSNDTAYFPSVRKAGEGRKLGDISTYHVLQNMQYPKAVAHDTSQVGDESIQKMMPPFVSQEYNEKQELSTLSHQGPVEDGDEGQSKIVQKAKDTAENFSKVTNVSVNTKYNIDTCNDTWSVSESCHMQVCDFQRLS